MLDLHSHILPGVDDGARSLEESERMLREAKSAGVTEIVASPHLYAFPPDMEKIDAAYAQLRPVAEDMGIQLHRGFEVYFDAVREVKDVEACCVQWDKPGKVLLLELPWQEFPERAAGMFSEWVRKGIQPVIVHPERYEFVQQDPEIAREWSNYGCRIQVNAGSYWKSLFSRERKAIHILMRKGMADFIASDAHRPGHYELLGKMLRKYPPEGLPPSDK